MYVAVICRGMNQALSSGVNGAWSSFIGLDREEVLSRALKHAEDSNGRPNKFNGKYVVLFGELTHHVALPVQYELHALPLNLTKEQCPSISS